MLAHPAPMLPGAAPTSVTRRALRTTLECRQGRWRCCDALWGLRNTVRNRHKFIYAIIMKSMKGMKDMKTLILHAFHALHGLKIKLAQVISCTFVRIFWRFVALAIAHRFQHWRSRLRRPLRKLLAGWRTDQPFPARDSQVKSPALPPRLQTHIAPALPVAIQSLLSRAGGVRVSGPRR